jgi:RNA polymerase sigma factor (sigma-70 family)
MEYDLTATVNYVMRHARIPDHLREDARQEAYVGAVQAARKFDGSCQFATYAQYRAAGQVRDFLRREDVLSRKHRIQVRNGETQGSKHVPLIVADRERATPPDQERRVWHAEIRSWLSVLNTQQRCVMTSLFIEERTLEKTADVLGLSLPYVWKVSNTSLAKLRAHLRWSNARKSVEGNVCQPNLRFVSPLAA